ncbi:MAG: hypothetical protein HYV63_05075 [Candidatus Schekmanbacteria bacterium]|nr:hypothetical protein [Candidatus Schekmanbacteria bacterium]
MAQAYLASVVVGNQRNLFFLLGLLSIAVGVSVAAGGIAGAAGGAFCAPLAAIKQYKVSDVSMFPGEDRLIAVVDDSRGDAWVIDGFDGAREARGTDPAR